MTKKLIYGMGLCLGLFVVLLLVYLTFDNAISGRAVFASKYSIASVSGSASIFVNLGIFGVIASFLMFLGFLFRRSVKYLKASQIVAAIGMLFIAVGLIWGRS
jgi:ABC-type uncharacterized transport system permease subunit